MYNPKKHTSIYSLLTGTVQYWLLYHAYNRGRTVRDQSKVLGMNYNERNYTVTHQESQQQNSEAGKKLTENNTTYNDDDDDDEKKTVEHRTHTSVTVT